MTFEKASFTGGLMGAPRHDGGEPVQWARLVGALKIETFTDRDYDSWRKIANVNHASAAGYLRTRYADVEFTTRKSPEGGSDIWARVKR